MSIFIKPQKLSVKYIDATWNMTIKGQGYKQYLKEHVPNAIHFDIDEIADQKSYYPHMVPSAEQFNKQMSSKGLKHTDKLVIYDQMGTFSSCRVYWMFKLFNHPQIQIMDGGLPLWKAMGLETTDKLPILQHRPNSYKGTLNRSLLKTFEDIQSTTSCIVDARSKSRFNGTEKEPRPIPGGHIPNSLNLPFSQLLTSTNQLKDKHEIQQLLDGLKLDKSKEIITTCGSGVTASILFAILTDMGYKASVYDGSWTEYSQRRIN